MEHLLSYEEFVSQNGDEISPLLEKKEKPSSKGENIPEGHIQHFLEEFAIM